MKDELSNLNRANRIHEQRGVQQKKKKKRETSAEAETLYAFLYWICKHGHSL